MSNNSTLTIVSLEDSSYAVRETDDKTTVSEFYSGKMIDNAETADLIADLANSSGARLPVATTPISKHLAYLLAGIVGDTHDADQVAMLLTGALSASNLKIVDTAEEQVMVWAKKPNPGVKGGKRGVTFYDLDPATGAHQS